MFPRQVRILLLLLLCIESAQVRADLEIIITKGVDHALPIAVLPFESEASHAAPPLDISRIIRADLIRSGHFSAPDFIAPKPYPQNAESVDFAAWHDKGMAHILVGNTRKSQGNLHEVDFRLVDILHQKQLLGFRISAKESQLRWAAHQIADIVFKKLTGIEGSFATRIAYITVRKNKGRKIHALHISDSDGHNPQILLKSTQPLLSPSWSPDGRKLAYVSFETKNSAIYVQDIYTGTRDQISSEPGINSSPAFSQDGTRLAMTLSKQGNPDIYVLYLKSRVLKRLTTHPAIDTEATWSPDGETIAFTSNRGGSPQIHTIPASGGRVKRLSFEGKYNARPRFSPDGKRIALVHSQGGAYRIAILELGSQYLQVLTDGRLDESPSFAPNGNMIVYATRSGSTAHLAAVAVDGSVQQQLRSQVGDVQEPVWGPSQHR
ncbi:MAG: Tol-Pal system beta propeller repeat protein TolB [Candidatus Eutrophobiaceae bacterium]